MKVSRAVAFALPALLPAAGCVHTLGTPSLKHGIAPFRHGPNVAALVTHTNCEIATAIYESTPRKDVVLSSAQSARHALWQKLSEENFVATVDFTLTATNTEGFNPSLNWVTPLTSGGHFISAIPSTDMSPTSAMYNRTLAVGVQASGTQDRNFDLTYLLDLERLYEAVQKDVLAGNQAKPDDHYVALSKICERPEVDSHTGLEGSLELAETIDFGLEGLKSGEKFNYGAEGPVPQLKLAEQRETAPVSTTGSQMPESTGGVTTESVAIAGGGAAPAGAGKTPAGPQSTNTTFSSKMDFTIVQGVNGGPSWQLLKWKIGGGSGGGGGGGGRSPSRLHRPVHRFRPSLILRTSKLRARSSASHLKAAKEADTRLRCQDN
jgi:hypothetical protein